MDEEVLDFAMYPEEIKKGSMVTGMVQLDPEIDKANREKEMMRRK